MTKKTKKRAKAPKKVSDMTTEELFVEISKIIAKQRKRIESIERTVNYLAHGLVAILGLPGHERE